MKSTRVILFMLVINCAEGSMGIQALQEEEEVIMTEATDQIAPRMAGKRPNFVVILTGRFTHNHGARNNTAEQGDCASIRWQQGPEKHALAVHMEMLGYATFYAGKYLNNYGFDVTGGPERIPPGWTEWFGLVGNSRYYNYTVSDNGVPVRHGVNYEDDYLTDVLKLRATNFIHKHREGDSPFMVIIGTPSAHASFTPAPQYETFASGLNAPRTPNFNMVYADKHDLLRRLEPLSAVQIAQTDEIFRKRLGTLKSVDELVGAIVKALGRAIEDTYILYTSDNGFHLGQFAMGFDKRQLYETDIRVPYFMRGPGIRRNSTSKWVVSHVDIAPTILDLAGAEIPGIMDGTPFTPALMESFHEKERKQSVLIQYYGESKLLERCGANNLTYEGDTAVDSGSFIPSPCDQWNNTYTCVRSVEEHFNDILCKFSCFDQAYKEVPCEPGTPESIGEYYDIGKDLYQRENTIEFLPESRRVMLEQKIERLRNCQGRHQCRDV